MNNKKKKKLWKENISPNAFLPEGTSINHPSMMMDATSKKGIPITDFLWLSSNDNFFENLGEKLKASRPIYRSVDARKTNEPVYWQYRAAAGTYVNTRIA